MYGYPENRDSTVGTLRRARVDRIDDKGAQQIMKKLLGLASEKPEDVYRAQSHGLSSHPPAGSEGMFLSLGGRADRMIGLGFEHKDKRPKDLPEGGTVLYDADGKFLKLVKDKATLQAGDKPFEVIGVTTVEIDAKGKVTIKTTEPVLIKAPRVDLGDEGGTGVATQAGISAKVFAVL